MQRTAVESSQIKSIGYEPTGDSTRGTLEIEFTNGAVYQYADVPAETHKALMEAESIGRYFNKFLKFGYQYKRVDVAPTGDAA